MRRTICRERSFRRERMKEERRAVSYGVIFDLHYRNWGWLVCAEEKKSLMTIRNPPSVALPMRGEGPCGFINLCLRSLNIIISRQHDLSTVLRVFTESTATLHKKNLSIRMSDSIDLGVSWLTAGEGDRVGGSGVGWLAPSS